MVLNQKVVHGENKNKENLKSQTMSQLPPALMAKFDQMFMTMT